jgi:hypothetical protein
MGGHRCRDRFPEYFAVLRGDRAGHQASRRNEQRPHQEPSETQGNPIPDFEPSRRLSQRNVLALGGFDFFRRQVQAAPLFPTPFLLTLFLLFIDSGGSSLFLRFCLQEEGEVGFILSAARPLFQFDEVRQPDKVHPNSFKARTILPLFSRLGSIRISISLVYRGLA